MWWYIIIVFVILVPLALLYFRVLDYFVEVAILWAISGILFAMAIPAFQKVREHQIATKIRAGERVSPDDMKWYRENAKKMSETKTSGASDTAALSEGPQTITLDGKRFYLIPKVTAEETQINGKVYWLVPISP